MAESLEKREHKRFELKKFPGPILLSHNKEAIPYLPLDVSKHGFRILSPDQLKPEVDVFMFMNGTTIALKVVWMKEDDGTLYPDTGLSKRVVHCYGLQTADKDLDLLVLFKVKGYIHLP